VIAAATGINAIDDPTIHLMSQVRRWLQDESNGQWTIVVDNIVDAAIFSSTSASQDLESAYPHSTPQGLPSFLPQSLNGSILAIARNHNVARRIKDTYINNVVFEMRKPT
jgi:hypothetical protein